MYILSKDLNRYEKKSLVNEYYSIGLDGIVLYEVDWKEIIF